MIVADELVDLTDFLPTVGDLSGLDSEAEELDGISFAPILFGEDRAKPREWVYSEHRGKRSIRSRDFRLYDDGRLFDLRSPRAESSHPLTTLDDAASQEKDRLSKRLARLTAETP